MEYCENIYQKINTTFCEETESNVKANRFK